MGSAVQKQLPPAEEEHPALGSAHRLPELLADLADVGIVHQVVAQVHVVHLATLLGHEVVAHRLGALGPDLAGGDAQLGQAALVVLHALHEGLGALRPQRVAAQVQEPESLVGGQHLGKGLGRGHLQPVVGEADVLERRVGLQRTLAQGDHAGVQETALGKTQRLHGLVLAEARAECTLHTLGVAMVAAQDDILHSGAVAQQGANVLEALCLHAAARQEQLLEGLVVLETTRQPLSTLVLDEVVREIDLLKRRDRTALLQLLEDRPDGLRAIAGGALVERGLRVLELLQVQRRIATVDHLAVAKARGHADGEDRGNGRHCG
mmetsp:Transcript_13684/g.29642  ORF Transcript_13684/g.29642 Transcript_13684/m.29642 type:complete len:321 (+) Transcript_13684:403-1365(+)